MDNTLKYLSLAPEKTCFYLRSEIQCGCIYIQTFQSYNVLSNSAYQRLNTVDNVFSISIILYMRDESYFLLLTFWWIKLVVYALLHDIFSSLAQFYKQKLTLFPLNLNIAPLLFLIPQLVEGVLYLRFNFIFV